jgi:hypothetical protein
VRTHRQLIVYQSILPVLHEPGCPFCKFLKEYQAARLQKRSETHRLCNFHASGLTAVQDAPAATQAFIGILNSSESSTNGSPECDICKEVAAGEDLRVRELATCLHRPDIADWLRAEAVLRIPHATKLRRQVPPILTSRIDSIVLNCRRQLKEQLGQPDTDRSGARTDRRVSGFATRTKSVMEGKC